MRLPAYAPHDRYVAPARASADPRLLLIGVLLIEGLYLLSLHLIDPFLALVPLADPDEVTRGSTPRGLLVQLTSFAALGLAVVLISRRLHARGLNSLIGPMPLALRQMLRVTLLLGALVLVLEFLPPGKAGYLEMAEMRPLPVWLALLPLSLLALLIQTGAEELFYRGYIQQQLAARFDHPAVWLILPSLLFASAHWSSELPRDEAVQYVIWAFFFGLAAADLTARSGTLGPAIGFHLVNNALAFLLYGEAGGADSGLALFLFHDEPDSGLSLLPPETQDASEPEAGILSGSFVMELAGIAILWIGTRLVLRR